MEIKIGKIKISGAALLALAAAFFFDSGGILAAVIIAAAVHETGHITALKICQRQISELKLELWGLSMRCDTRMSYKSEIITAAAGPLMSMLLALTASLLGRKFDYQEAYIISGVSLIFCVFNALPALPLDGGKIIYAITAIVFDAERAEQISCILTCAVIMALMVAGTIILLKTKLNFTLLLAAVWLLLSYCKRSGISIKSNRKINGSEKWIRD
jgi:stage IV sporulation protein FB